MIYYLFYVPKVEREREREKEKGVGEGGTGLEKLDQPTM